MASAIMSDAAVAARGEKEHLVFEGIGAERSSMAENHRLPHAPILVINRSTVLRGNRAHRSSSLLVEDLRIAGRARSGAGRHQAGSGDHGSAADQDLSARSER